MKKKRTVTLLLLLFIIFINSFSYADSEKYTYVIPIEGEINKATSNFVINTINKLNNRNDVEAIIFEINTYGGLIDKAIEIKDKMVETDIKTISYVNNKAESAGVLLTIASESIIMSDSATIGSAETIPNTEKVLSMWKGILRSTAEYRDRDPVLVEAMADSDIEIDGIIEKGKLLNLTSKEASEYGLSDGTLNNYEDILKKYKLEDTKLVVVEENIQIKVAKYISSPYISSTLLTLAFVGMVVEILTPGFGIGGTLSILAFGLYFGGNILAGYSNLLSLALFITGFILLIIEVIVPGFGLPGISGIILLVVGIIMAMKSIKVATLSISIALTLTVIITTILIKLGFKSKMFDKVILSTSVPKKVNEDENKESYDNLLGKEAITISNLRPTGFIEIDGNRLDALAEDGFIPPETKVEVVKINGNKIFVRRM